MELAYACLQEEIAREFERHMEIRDRLFTEEKRRRYMDIVNRKGSQYGEHFGFLSGRGKWAPGSVCMQSGCEQNTGYN